MQERSDSYDRFETGLQLGTNDDACSVRKQILLRDAVRVDQVSASCAVEGRWNLADSKRTTTRTRSLEVAPLVPLREAWSSGASRWSDRKRAAFIGDVGYRWSLQLVTSGSKTLRASTDPATWMPARTAASTSRPESA